MQADAIEEWRRLREHYSQLSEEELDELALDFVDLTGTARQVLSDEMRTRGLVAPQAPGDASKVAAALTAPRLDPNPSLPDSASSNQQPGLPHEYTWKTPLCEREDFNRAWQIHRVLERAGIESWIEQPGSRYSDGAYPFRVMVAADQLEAAIEIAAAPIPSEIVEESQMGQPEYEPPSCPKCGARDPVLEGVNPWNLWRCEACGNGWTESAESLNSAAMRDGKEETRP
jgi:hypothetical protein